MPVRNTVSTWGAADCSAAGGRKKCDPTGPTYLLIQELGQDPTRHWYYSELRAALPRLVTARERRVLDRLRNLLP